jgi:hypothetical protein
MAFHHAFLPAASIFFHLVVNGTQHYCHELGIVLCDSFQCHLLQIHVGGRTLREQSNQCGKDHVGIKADVRLVATLLVTLLKVFPT